MHILPQRYPGQGIAAFVDFYDVHAAVDAVQTAHTISGREIRVNYKFKDGGGPRFGRHEQSPSRHEKERYGDKKTQRRYKLMKHVVGNISCRDGNLLLLLLQSFCHQVVICGQNLL